MKKLRRHLTFANVVACLALFIALGGASYAAVNLPKNSVGTKQLKNNAVVTKKIKKNAVNRAKIRKGAINTARLKGNAVTTAKIRAGAVNSSKVADGSITGADINAPTAPFSQIVESLGGNASVPFGKKPVVYPLSSSTYTQAAGRLDQYFGSIDVTFSAMCEAPRDAVAYLLVDAPNPMEPTENDIIGWVDVRDEGSGEVTRQAVFTFLPGFGGGPWQPAPAADTPHTFTVLLNGESCESGAGITATGATINVVGTK